MHLDGRGRRRWLRRQSCTARLRRHSRVDIAAFNDRIRPAIEDADVEA